jgi:two-component system, NarL family, invasion response regulator UvrY
MINILLVDDQSIVRTGLKHLLNDAMPALKTEEAVNGNIALKKISKNTFDLVILDVNIPNTDSFALISRILAESPDCKILLFSTISDYGALKRYIKSGIMGFVNKNSECDDILQAVKTILGGRRYVSQEIMNAILEDKFFSVSANPFDMLSEREYEITRRLLTGDNLTTIAQMLNIHTSTVGTHKSKVFVKLNVSNLVELVTLARNYELT